MAAALTFDLDVLRTFVEVATRLSFFEAAEELALSPSALTRRIKRLEAGVGLDLFERTTRRVALTPAGREFLPHAQAVLAAEEGCLRWLQTRAHSGEEQLTLACLPSISRTLLPRLITAFAEQRPRVRVRILESHLATQVRQLAAGEVDLALGFLPESCPGLVIDELMTDPYDLACPPHHPLAAGASVPWAELKPHPLIVSGSGRNSGNRRVLEDVLHKLDHAPGRLVEIEHLSTALGLVEAGLGITVVPRSALSPELRQRLAIRPLVEPQVSRTLGLLRRRGGSLTPAARHFRLALQRMAPLDVDRLEATFAR